MQVINRTAAMFDHLGAVSEADWAPRALVPERLPAPERVAGGLGVTIRALEKSFGPKQVLRGIDLDVPPGQFVAVIGQSGCGKSTLLRLLAGLDAPTGGRLSLGEGNVDRRAVRIMFQEPRLLPWARVVQNVEVGLLDAQSSAERRQRALAMLAEVGLEDRQSEWPAILSGGQRQRVALARALASRPQVMALDEPLAALDALTRIEMQKLLERIWLQQGFTAVLVTHDVGEALALADRVVLIEDGAVVLDLAVALPRPRRRGSPELARLEGQILDRLFEAQPTHKEIEHGAALVG